MSASKPGYCAIGLFLFCIAPISVRAQNHQLVFTEESSKVLTAKLDGVTSYGTVEYLSLDHWKWSIVLSGDVNFSSFTGNPFWQEPGGESGVNSLDPIGVSTSGQPTYSIFVTSEDRIVVPPGDVVPNGALGPTLSLSDVNGNFLLGPLDIYFNDLGDTNVPENASSLGMLLVTVAGLVGAGRLRAAREC
jgi:hypothetical protein